MIKTEELRIGNWVLRGDLVKDYENSESPIKLVPNKIETIQELFDYNDFEPIPLTEELLLKCGFEECGYELLFWEHDKISFQFSGINWADSDNPEYQFLNFECGKAKIYYLHQLQNLYFALTGEELNIDL